MSLNDVVIVRPLVVTRFANTVPGLVVLTIAVFAPVPLLVSYAVCIVGGLLVIRGFRTGVRLNEDSVTVYGYLWSRTIPRRAIVDLTTFPALRWTSRSGGSRWTPLLMFVVSTRALAFINAHHERCRQLLLRELHLPRGAKARPRPGA